MRHRIATKTLSVDTDHRKALLRNLANSLITHEKMVTTLVKAKFVKPYVEKLVTRAKIGNDFNNIKLLTSKLPYPDSVRKLISDIAVRFKETAGGYTRVVKLPNRPGDNTPMARIEFVKSAEKTEKIEAKEKKVTKKKVKATKAKKEVSNE